MPAPTSSLTSHHDPFRLAFDDGDQTSPAEILIYDLLGASVIHAEDWQQVGMLDRERILRSGEKAKALSVLVDLGLITQYQAARVSAGTLFGLVLGNYRILDRIGAGGMAVVFKAEHLEMRHLAAIKVLPMSAGQDPRLETRFTAEMRAVARLHHPNIVTALDAGRAFSSDPDAPVLWYLVMEYVAGQDLHDLVVGQGPMPLVRACNLMHQAASALSETHRFGLVHRDIKPSNILVTPEDQAKLLDFGLSRRLDTRLTQPGTVLGTVDFMAPEQARDASSVDIRADIYSLGGTFYWCLAGDLPFPNSGSPTECILRRLNQPPPSIRNVRPEMPAELDAVLAKMMALHPDDRYATPEAVLKALLPFLKPESRTRIILDQARPLPSPSSVLQGTPAPRTHRILIVDDERGIREFCKEVLRCEGVLCDEAPDGVTALTACARTHYDLVLLDVYMPRMSGREVLQQLRQDPPTPNLKVILFSGQATPDDMSQMLLSGADDYLTKPFSVVQLLGRVQTALRLKDAQDRSDDLNRQLLDVNAELENNLSARDSDLAHTRNSLVLALAKLVDHRESGGEPTPPALAALRPLPGGRGGPPPGLQQPDHRTVHRDARLLCSLARRREGRVARPYPAQAREAGPG